MSSLFCWGNHLNDPERTGGFPTVSVTNGSAVTNYPESNLIDTNNNTEWRRTITPSVTVTLDVSTGMGPAGDHGVAAVVLSNMSFLNSGKDKSAWLIRLQVGSGGFGSNLVYDGYRVMFPTSKYGCPKNAVWIIDPASLNNYRRCIGGIPSSVANQFRFQFINDTTSATLVVGGLYIMYGMKCLLKEGGLSLGGADESIIQRPYEGFPYVQKRSKYRRVQGTLTDLDRFDVFGGARGGFQFVSGSTIGPQAVRACVSTINYTAGKSSPVMICPNAALGSSPFSTLAGVFTAGANWDTDLKAQSTNVFGYMEESLQAQHIAMTEEGGQDNQSWEAQFAIQEAFGYSL